MSLPDGTLPRARFALALGGGGARGLAHLGVLEVLEREGLLPQFVAGSSMGGLVGALYGGGWPSGDILALARHFRFPRWFIPGGLLGWEQVFPGTAEALPASFEELHTPVALTAVDIESGSQVVLHRGRLLPEVRATCALPGVFPPERIAGRWLVDGAVANVLPVDVAWMADPDIVMAVRVSGPRARRLPALEWRLTRVLATVGRLLPNPATAMLSLEVLTRAAEITLERQTALCAAMTDPEILIEPELGDMGLRDFRSVDLAVAAGRHAAESALPALQRMLATPPRRSAEARELFSRNVDPVCAMAIHPMRARATAIHDGRLYFFCSVNCRDRFRRSPARYLDTPRLSVGTAAGP